MATTEPTWHELYSAYRVSPDWQAKRLAALETAENRCQLCCSEKDLEVHHRTYERLGHERPADLTVLCEDCHVRFHNRLVVGPQSYEADIRVLEFLERHPHSTMYDIYKGCAIGIELGVVLHGLEKRSIVRTYILTDAGRESLAKWACIHRRRS
jgi:hypothetical protein